MLDGGHGHVITKAIQILEHDGHRSYANWARIGVACGSIHADAAGPTFYLGVDLSGFLSLRDAFHYKYPVCNYASFEHFYNPLTDKGLNLSSYGDLYHFATEGFWAITSPLFPLVVAPISADPGPDFSAPYTSAVDVCQAHYTKAVSIWNGKVPSVRGWSNNNRALWHLGLACHMLADLAISPHTVSDKFWEHDDFEKWAEAKNPETGKSLLDDCNAESIGADLTQWGLDREARQIAVDCARETHSELHLYEAGETRWSDAHQKGIPRAERYTAILLAKFFHEVGVSEQSWPLSVTILDTDQVRVPHAFLFYRVVAADGGLTDWEILVANGEGQVCLPHLSGRTYELRPAMPGYAFEGKYSADWPGYQDTHALESPVRYSPPVGYAGKPSLTLILRRTCGSDPRAEALAPRLDVGALSARGFLSSDIGPLRPRRPNLLDLKITNAIEQQMEVVAMEDENGSPARLATGGLAYLRIAIAMIVNPATGDFVRSREELTALIQARESARTQPRSHEENRRVSLSPAVQKALARWPRQKTTDASGKVSYFCVSPMVRTTGEPSHMRELFQVPGAEATEVKLEVVPAAGCAGFGFTHQVGITASLDPGGVAFVRLKAGSQEGVLRVRVTVIKVPGLSQDMLPSPRMVDVVTSPDRQGGIDQPPETSPSLEQVTGS